MRLSRSRCAKVTLLLLAVLIYLARVLWMDHGRYALYDDAFVSFRYADNLAHGHGLVFNPGQRVEGYTNFLWTVLLAAGIQAGVDPIGVTKIVGTASGLGIIVLTSLLSTKLAPEAGIGVAFPSLLLAATASLPRYAVSGMETLMFSLWLCLALWVELEVDYPKGGVLAAAVLALASLTRPEGVLFFGVFTAAWAVERVWRGEAYLTVLRRCLPRLFVFGIIYLPYFLWRCTYYRCLLPNTFYAKAGGLNLVAARRGLQYLSKAFLITNLPMSICGLLAPLALRRRRVFATLLTAVAYLVYVVMVGGDDFPVFGPRFVLIIFPLDGGSWIGWFERVDASAT